MTSPRSSVTQVGCSCRWGPSKNSSLSLLLSMPLRSFPGGSAQRLCPNAAPELHDARGRHLDSCQFQTYLHARPPRVQCPTHGVKQVRLPWAEERARFTTLFERLAIDVLLETDILGATRILRISWDEAWHIQERAVARG